MCWTYPEDGLCAEEFQEGMQKEEVGGWKASWRRDLTNVDPGDAFPLSRLSYIMLEKSGSCFLASPLKTDLYYSRNYADCSIMLVIVPGERYHGFNRVDPLYLMHQCIAVF